MAGWPKAAARSTSESIFAAPSSSEYSEWTWRCTAGPGGIESHYGVELGAIRGPAGGSLLRAEKAALRPLEHVAQHRIAEVGRGPDQPGADLAGHVQRPLVVGVHVDVDALEAEALEAEVAHHRGRLGRVSVPPARRAEAVTELDLRAASLEWDQTAVANQLTARDLLNRPQRVPGLLLEPHEALHTLARLVERRRRPAQKAPHQRIRVVDVGALDIIRSPAPENQALAASDFQRYSSSPDADFAATTPPTSTSAIAPAAPSFALFCETFHFTNPEAIRQTSQPRMVYPRVVIGSPFPGYGLRTPSATGGSTAR